MYTRTCLTGREDLRTKIVHFSLRTMFFLTTFKVGFCEVLFVTNISSNNSVLALLLLLLSWDSPKIVPVIPGWSAMLMSWIWRDEDPKWACYRCKLGKRRRKRGRKRPCYWLGSQCCRLLQEPGASPLGHQEQLSFLLHLCRSPASIPTLMPPPPPPPIHNSQVWTSQLTSATINSNLICRRRQKLTVGFVLCLFCRQLTITVLLFRLFESQSWRYGPERLGVINAL